jgi:hypothetical protein
MAPRRRAHRVAATLRALTLTLTLALALATTRALATATTVDVNDAAMADADLALARRGARTRANALGALATTAAEVLDAVGALAAPGPKPGGKAKPYGDPARRECLATEMKVQIQGVPGDFCSPSCSVASPCPEDPYRGATARGMCVLQTPGSDRPNRCALVCNPRDEAPNGGCPKGASCRPVAQVGICTYPGP